MLNTDYVRSPKVFKHSEWHNMTQHSWKKLKTLLHVSITQSIMNFRVVHIIKSLQESNKGEKGKLRVVNNNVREASREQKCFQMLTEKVNRDWAEINGSAFSALTLLVGQQEGHPTCKKTEWWGTGVVICLEWGADLQLAQLLSLPLTVSCSSKIQIGFTFLVPAYPGCPGKEAVIW